jgi:aryl-alcohol dehydrogenase-like predicted oxidoreductase
LEHGINFFDTAALYGFGANETLLGKVLKPHRSKIVLASKCGMTGVDGKRVIDGRPEILRRTCEESLQRLQTDVIDLYYLHRRDFKVPIEDSIGALADLVRAGKIRSIGLSEVSAATLRRAHAVHPVAALQSEYSLWTRNAELGTLAACRELGTAYVAFSPLARAYLTGTLTDPEAQLEAKDIRRQMPRFDAANYARNLALLPAYMEHCARSRLQPGATGPGLAAGAGRGHHSDLRHPAAGASRRQRRGRGREARSQHGRAARRTHQPADRDGAALQRGDPAGNRYGNIPELKTGGRTWAAASRNG